MGAEQSPWNMMTNKHKKGVYAWRVFFKYCPNMITINVTNGKAAVDQVMSILRQDNRTMCTKTD